MHKKVDEFYNRIRVESKNQFEYARTALDKFEIVVREYDHTTLQDGPVLQLLESLNT
jgi:hypothetical protein